MSDPGNFTIRQAPMPADRFRIISNDFLRGVLPVPLRALERCILGLFISLPTGWKINRKQVDDSVEEGRDAVSKALKRLQEAGYLRRGREHVGGGVWEWTWEVTADPIGQPLPEIPSTENQSVAPTSANTAKPQVTPSTGIPSMENQSIKKKTDQENKDLEEARDPALFEVFGQTRSGGPRITSEWLPAFDAFWSAYPKKTDKVDARRAYLKILKEQSDGATVVALQVGAERYAASRKGEDPKYTKGPAAWLRAGKWLDELPPVPRSVPVRNTDWEADVD